MKAEFSEKLALNNTLYTPKSTATGKNSGISHNQSYLNETSKIKSKETHQYKELSESEKKIVSKLKAIEKEVIAHENSHISAGGGLVRGGASYSYALGPDGKRYITGGEVKIDVTVNSDDPQSAIIKMQQVSKAALAPANPSAQDKAVASEAAKIEAQARLELNLMNAENYKKQSKKTNNSIDFYI